jgi:hypothetical protein
MLLLKLVKKEFLFQKEEHLIPIMMKVMSLSSEEERI